MSKVKFLNHSSVIIEHKKIKILCDPWFKGKAFNDSWKLLYENSHDINKLDFDYIWISHEHPDHFSIATLNSLRKKTTFLYQHTFDKKVKNYLEIKGHKVIELKDTITKKLEGIDLTLFICDGYDASLLCRFSDGKYFLNINDARVELGNEIGRIRKLLKKPPDLIATQFSYANWAGNKNENYISKFQQELVNKRNIKIIKKFKPNAVMLFASYIYYCHQENFYWNKNKYLFKILNSFNGLNSKIIIPKPNQQFLLSKIKNDKDLKKKNNLALSFWKKKYKKISINSYTKNIKINELKQYYTLFYQNLWRDNYKKSIKFRKDYNFNLKILILDHNIKIKIGLFKKRFNIINDNEQCDCSISSETFAFLMKNKFGRGTVTINSRIEFNYNYAHRFFIFFYFFYLNNLGVYIKKNKIFFINKLESIKKTSVMSSILKYNKNSKKIMEKDLKLIFKNYKK